MNLSNLLRNGRTGIMKRKLNNVLNAENQQSLDKAHNVKGANLFSNKNSNRDL